MENLFSLVRHITWRDICDMTIVAFLIYRLMLIVQGTRAVQMLGGLVAVTILYAISYSYELYALNWLLQHFFASFFVLIIVLFQDQIRTALVAFGEARFFDKRKRGRYSYVIEEVVAATSALSKEKTGALIVFERVTGLMNYSATGTKLDAKIHSDVIYSLFQSNSSLHDGAMLLHEDRIVAAGCFLPLSKAIEIDRQYGTRHRAALGITEVSDAVVVVVSEETGRISLCYEGFFYRVEEENDLRKNLRKILESTNRLQGTKEKRKNIKV